MISIRNVFLDCFSFFSCQLMRLYLFISCYFLWKNSSWDIHNAILGLGLGLSEHVQCTLNPELQITV